MMRLVSHMTRETLAGIVCALITENPIRLTTDQIKKASQRITTEHLVCIASYQDTEIELSAVPKDILLEVIKLEKEMDNGEGGLI